MADKRPVTFPEPFDFPAATLDSPSKAVKGGKDKAKKGAQDAKKGSGQKPNSKGADATAAEKVETISEVPRLRLWVRAAVLCARVQVCG